MKILINFPTNLGDAIMGLPVLDRLKQNYPQASISAIASEKTKELLAANSFVDKVISFDKLWPIKDKLKFCLDLRGEYDLMADLKNSLLPVLLGVKKRTPFVRNQPDDTLIKDIYLSLLDKIAPIKEASHSQFLISDSQENKWASYNLGKVIFVACSSLSGIKQYPAMYLKQVLAGLTFGQKVVILGQARDRKYYDYTLKAPGVIDLVGQTAMSDVAYLLENHGALLLCVDSSILHLGSYLNLAIAALYGPTSPKRYGPWSERSKILTSENMAIEPDKVIAAAKELLE